MATSGLRSPFLKWFALKKKELFDSVFPPRDKAQSAGSPSKYVYSSFKGKPFVTQQLRQTYSVSNESFDALTAQSAAFNTFLF